MEKRRLTTMMKMGTMGIRKVRQVRVRSRNQKSIGTTSR